jgi:Trypsin-like peptidase domain
VIETDGSRPVLFVQDGTIDLDAPQLRETIAGRWLGAAANFKERIEKVVSAVGGVQLPSIGKRRVGTAFAIAPGVVVTNRHVLEDIARFEDGQWRWKCDAEIDFVGEHERPGTNVFKLKEVILTGPNPINRRINFANLDLAVIRVEGNASLFPTPLTLEKNPDCVRVGEGPRPPVYVIGFPAEPLPALGSPSVPPPAGHEYQEVLEKLFAGRFGKKRWAPGLVEAGAGQLSGDTRQWVMSHDCSTLAGNSGSCIADFATNGERVMGLHFGGRARVENYAHVVSALQQDLALISGIHWDQ